MSSVTARKKAMAREMPRNNGFACGTLYADIAAEMPATQIQFDLAHSRRVRSLLAPRLTSTAASTYATEPIDHLVGTPVLCVALA